MSYPSWWQPGVRVVTPDGRSGRLMAVNGGWLFQPEDSAAGYVVDPDPTGYQPEVRQRLTLGQLDRVAHDTERALLRAFGCHYIPEFEALPETMRSRAPRPVAYNRPELDGLQAVLRGAVLAALAPYATDA